MFPSVVLTCVNEKYATEFGAWLVEKGWIHDVKGVTVTVVGSYAGFAVDVTNEAIDHGWATSFSVAAALVKYGMALDGSQYDK